MAQTDLKIFSKAIVHHPRCGPIINYAPPFYGVDSENLLGTDAQGFLRDANGDYLRVTT